MHVHNQNTFLKEMLLIVQIMSVSYKTLHMQFWYSHIYMQLATCM